MSIWGDLVGDTKYSQQSLLTEQQDRVMSNMGSQADRLQNLGQGMQATDVSDPGYAGRYDNLKSDVLARANREAGNVRHSAELHSTGNMLKQAQVKQNANMSLAGMEQQQMNDQLRQQEQANVRNEFMRKQYFDQANQLRSNIASRQSVENIVDQETGLAGNAMAMANTGLQLAKTFTGA